MRTKVQRSHLIPVNPQNATSNDWVILLEAGTIIGPSPERLRVARSTLERKIVKKNTILSLRRNISLCWKDMIHEFMRCSFALNFTSMIRKKKLVPLQGDEIGRLIAHAVEGGITERRPWYDPSEELPDRPIIDVQMNTEFDTLVVDMPSAERARTSSPT